METKTCNKCGREFPKDMFYKKAASSDGLQPVCKDCSRANNKVRYEHLKAMKRNGVVVNVEDSANIPNNLHKVYSNPDLARFTPRELMAELKARGFKWEYMLEPQRKVMFDKI